MLDIVNYTSIIYIWYEDGLLKPFLVTDIANARVAIV
jgi:hypothetical protein